MLNQIIAYASHLAAALVLLVFFMMLYLKLTPYDEITLIRGGNMAAALTLGGALLGFALTLASSLAHNDSLQKFLMWSALSMAVQALTFLLATRLVRHGADHIASNNVAMGALVGLLSLTVGLINAACLT